MSRRERRAVLAAYQTYAKRAKAKSSCHHPDAPSTCHGGIVDAHTVSRSALAKIASGSHVLAYSPDIFSLESTGGRHYPKQVGIGSASAIRCFCAKHDRDMFSCIENEAFSFSSRQCFALTYRAIIFELSAKLATSTIRKAVATDSKFPGQLQHRARFAADLDDYAIRDLQAVKASLVQAHRSESPEIVSFVGFEFEGPQSLLCSGAQFPLEDFQGRTLQSLDPPSSILQPLTVSVLPGRPNQTFVVFAWLSGHTAPRDFVRSLIVRAPEDIGALIQGYVTLSFENVYFSPTWWESTDEDLKEAIVDRSFRNASPTDPFGSPEDAGDPVLASWRLIETHRGDSASPGP